MNSQNNKFNYTGIGLSITPNLRFVPLGLLLNQPTMALPTPAILLSLLLCSATLHGFQLQCSRPATHPKQPLLMSNRQAYVETKYGLGLIVDAKDEVVYKGLASEGTWDAHFLYLLSKLVSQNQTVLNIGSQTGLEAVILGKTIGEGGRLFVMESSSLNYRILVKNIHLNGLEGIARCYLVAAGMESNWIYLEINEKQPEKGLLTYRTSDSTGSQFETVTVERVDRLLPPATKLDFAYVKSGVYQFQALYGMKEIMSQSLSLIVLVKHNYFYLENRDYVNAPQLFFQFLEKTGFVWLQYIDGEECSLGRLEPVDWKQLLMPKDYTLLLVGPEVGSDKKMLLGIT